MLYALQTIPGLGTLAWREAEAALAEGAERGPKLVGIKAVPGRDDIVLFAHKGGPRRLLGLRASEDAFAVAARAYRVAPDERGLRQIYAAVRNSEDTQSALDAWRRATGARSSAGKPQGGTFRVIARSVGRQKFMRRDVGRAVSDAVRDSWPGTWRPVDEDADLEIWATLVEQELICAIRLSDASMRQRGKTRHLPASLRPALAAAMVALTEPERDDIFVDPMAGAGTLLVERAAAGPFAEIHGGDLSTDAVNAMKENVRGIKGTVVTSRWDARRLPFEDGSVDKVAVNLPFGKQVSNAAQLPELYRASLAEIARVLRSGGRLVALAGDARALESARAAAARVLRPGPRHRVIVLGQNAMICEYTRL
jgi:tRNA (guanine6-N2)-methyltransferase